MKRLLVVVVVAAAVVAFQFHLNPLIPAL